MKNVSKTKSQSRQEILSLRKYLSEGQVRTLSVEITARFIKLLSLRQVSPYPLNVGMYRSTMGEVDLQPLESLLKTQGARLHFPRVTNQTKAEMEFVDITGLLDSVWKVGPYGIMQPQDSYPAVSPELLDLIFIPGVVFGTNGERLGMGKGFYDRFLRKNRRGLRVALAYDFQVVEGLSQDEWDEPVHWIITEKREFRSHFFELWYKNTPA